MALGRIKTWPRRPVIYEINTWVWLNELSSRYGRPIQLGSVPAKEWDQLAEQNFDGVWLMGVWERSPAGHEISLNTPSLQEEYRRILPDFRPEDVSGSPYCVHRYVVDERLGGKSGLAAARKALAGRELRLLLDFVPNHVAPDHPWVTDHPEYFVQGSREDVERDPASFVARGSGALARGRDPYFPAWPDTVQLNAFSPGLRMAVADTLAEIAGQCDGVRCDMAMLVLNEVFSRTWKDRVGPVPESEYWREVIGNVRKKLPSFLFVAEAYWDLEWELQQQGFDFCYDKRLYDRLVHEDAHSIRGHLSAGLEYQDHLMRFLENHDEPRSAATFSGAKERAAAMVVMTTPGAKLLHEGQSEGARVKLSVHLGRRPQEPVDTSLREFYGDLLRLVTERQLLQGEWHMCECQGWADNRSSVNLLAWCWNKGDMRHVIVINYSDFASQGMVQIPWNDLRGRPWALSDDINRQTYEARDGDAMSDSGLYVALPPWGYHFMKLTAETAKGRRKVA